MLKCKMASGYNPINYTVLVSHFLHAYPGLWPVNPEPSGHITVGVFRLRKALLLRMKKKLGWSNYTDVLVFI